MVQCFSGPMFVILEGKPSHTSMPTPKRFVNTLVDQDERFVPFLQSDAGVPVQADAAARRRAESQLVIAAKKIR